MTCGVCVRLQLLYSSIQLFDFNLLFILQAVVTVVSTAVAAVILPANVPREGVTGEADEADEEDGVVEENVVMTLVLIAVTTRDTDFGDEDITRTPPLLVRWTFNQLDRL